MTQNSQKQFISFQGKKKVFKKKKKIPGSCNWVNNGILAEKGQTWEEEEFWDLGEGGGSTLNSRYITDFYFNSTVVREDNVYDLTSFKCIELYFIAQNLVYFG